MQLWSVQLNKPKVMQNEVKAPLTAEQQRNLETVNALFAAFAMGDVPAILSLCADDCEWHHGGDPDAIPFAKKFTGKTGVGEFFQSVGQSISVSGIAPTNFVAAGSEVSHDFHVEATVNATGKSYVADVRYVWTFDERGNICRHRSHGDFSSAEAAFRA